MSTEATRTTARRIVEALARRDLQGAIDRCRPDCKFHGFAPRTLDVAGYRENLSAFLDAFPDSRFLIDDVIAEGDRAAVRHRFQGTHLAEFQGVPATGRLVTVSGIAVFRMVDGKVAETWLNADSLGLWQQLGAVPAAQLR